MKKKELNDEDHIYMTEILAELADIFKDEVDVLHKATGKSTATCLGDCMRPFFRDAFKSVRSENDKRVRKYGAKMYVWDIDEGMARSSLVREFDIFECAGLGKIGDGIRERVGEAHNTDAVEIKAFGRAKLDDSLARHRTSISKGNGTATKRIYYKYDGVKYMMQATIYRVDKNKS